MAAFLIIINHTAMKMIVFCIYCNLKQARLRLHGSSLQVQFHVSLI